MYTSIVVGYDDSLSSKAALKEASLRVKQRGGSLVLVHAVYFDKEEFAILPSQMEKRFEMGTHVCLDAKKSLKDDFGLNGSVESIVCEGEPPEVIVETAQGKNADLIALGTYGRKGLKRLLMGSVTSQVILNAPCDVLVVKNPCSKCAGKYRSLLVPFDGSGASRKALVRACQLAKADDAQVTVLYVIPRYEEMMDFIKTESIKTSLHLEAEKITAAARAIANAEGVQVHTQISDGYSEDKIVAIASKQQHDLIVMATHGWRGMNKAIMGSTTERVIAHGNSPILIVK